jgi:hypothetical protein
MRGDHHAAAFTRAVLENWWSVVANRREESNEFLLEDRDVENGNS